MAYYLLKTEDGQTMTLSTKKEYKKGEVLSICKNSNGELLSLLRSLQMSGICRCFTQKRPRFSFTILLKDNGEIEVEQHPEYRIVMYGERGNLIRVEAKLYDSEEEAEQRLNKLQEAYVYDLFVAVK